MSQDEEPTGLRGLLQSLDERDKAQIKFLLRTLGIVIVFVILASAIVGVVVTLL
jgi:hypothetical protein